MSSSWGTIPFEFSGLEKNWRQFLKSTQSYLNSRNIPMDGDAFIFHFIFRTFQIFGHLFRLLIYSKISRKNMLIIWLLTFTSVSAGKLVDTLKMARLASADRRRTRLYSFLASFWILILVFFALSRSWIICTRRKSFKMSDRKVLALQFSSFWERKHTLKMETLMKMMMINGM